MLTNKNRAALAISTLWTAFFLLIFTGCQPSGPKSLLLGDKYVRQGDYPKALKYLGRAAAFMPERPEVWNLQGLSYHGLQQPGRAVEAYQRALRIDRNFAPAHFNLGVLLLEQDRPTDAVGELNAYVALRPRDDQGWSRLGAALVRVRKADEADRALSQALKLNPKNADAHNTQGLVHILRKRPRDAMQSFNVALENRPGFGPALLNQAIVAQQFFGNSQIALERYRAFLGSKPDPRASAAVQLAIRQIEQASLPTPPRVPLADLTTNTGIGTLLRSNLAQQADRARAQDNAARQATGATITAATPAPTNLPVVPTPKAVAPNPPATVAVAASTPPANPIPAAVQTPAALKTNLPAIANPSVVAQAPATNQPAGPSTTAVTPPALAAAPATPQPAANPATNAPTAKVDEPEPAPAPIEVVAVNKEPEFQAPKDIDSAVAKPSVPEAVEEKPLIAPRKRTEQEKRGLLARLKSANPVKWFEHDEPRTELKPIPSSTPPVPPAAPPAAQPEPPVVPPESTPHAPVPAPAAQAAPVREPVRPVARYEYRKDLQLGKGDRARAQKPFAQANLSFQQGRLEDAIALYRQAIAADPGYFEAHYNLGLAAYQAKDLLLALSANEEAVALKPSSVDARYNFAITLREARYYTDAAHELRQLLSDSPNEARAHLALANIYSQQLDEPALARTHYQRFLDLAPNHPEAPTVRDWLVSRR